MVANPQALSHSTIGYKFMNTLAKTETDINSSGYKSQAWRTQIKAWERCYDLWQSPMYVQDKGEAFLRKFPLENPIKYQERLKQSVPQGKLRECIETMAGMVFKDDPAPMDAPKALAELFKDIDSRGNSLHSFLQTSFAKYLRDGGGAIHVDCTRLSPEAQAKVERGEQLTSADRAKDRPFWSWIDAKEMINYREYAVTGVVTPILIVIQKCEIEPAGMYGETEVLRNYIFLEDGTFEVEYWDEKKGTWVNEPDKSGNTKLGEITISMAAPYGSQPPMLTLAMLDVLHYNKESDFDDWCHNACVPERIYNFDTKQDAQEWAAELKNSASTARAMWGQNAKAYFNEVGGKGIDIVGQRLEKIEARISALGVGMLSPSDVAPKSATEVVDTAGQRQSKLAYFAREFENCVEKAFYFTLKILQQIGGAAVDLTQAEGTTLKLKMDFDRLTFTPERLQVFKDLLANGDMSRLTFWELVEKSEDMPEDWTPELEIQRLDEEDTKLTQQMGKNTLTALKNAQAMPNDTTQTQTQNTTAVPDSGANT